MEMKRGEGCPNVEVRHLWKRWGALMYRSEGHPLIVLKWCLHVGAEVGMLLLVQMGEEISRGRWGCLLVKMEALRSSTWHPLVALYSGGNDLNESDKGVS